VKGEKRKVKKARSRDTRGALPCLRGRLLGKWNSRQKAQKTQKKWTPPSESLQMSSGICRSVAGVHGDAGVLGVCGDGRDSVMMVAIEAAIGMARMAAERMALRRVAVVLLD